MVKVDRTVFLLVAEAAGEDEPTITVRGNEIWAASETRIFKANVVGGETIIDQPIIIDHRDAKEAMPLPGHYEISQASKDSYVTMTAERKCGSWVGRASYGLGNRAWMHYGAIITAIAQSRNLRSITVRAGDLLRAAALATHGAADDDPVTIYLPDETLPALFVREIAKNDERVAAIARMDDGRAQRPNLWKRIQAPSIDEVTSESKAKRR